MLVLKIAKLLLDETKGDIEKSVEFLRKKGIAKASKKMTGQHLKV